MKDTYYPRQAVTRLLLNLEIQDVQKNVTVTQGDTNRRIEVTLVDGARSFEVPDTWYAVLAGVTPSGEEDVYEACDIRNGKVVFDFTGGTVVSAEPGTSVYSFDVFDEDGNVVASPKIWVTVLKSTRRLEQDTTVQRLSLLQEFIERTNQSEGEA